MKYFSIPSDFMNDTIDKYNELNNMYADSKLIETYGQLTDFGEFNKIGSGRSLRILPQADIKTLEKYVKYSLDKKIQFNYALNSSCMGNTELSKDGVKELYNFLKQLSDIGVTSLTVAMPSVIELIKTLGFNFKIKASAICQISSANKALFYKKLGVERVVIDEDIIRKFESIQEICSAFGNGTEVIVNSLCTKNCAYKMFHYNHESHSNENISNKASGYYYNRCIHQISNDIRNSLKLNWVRPEDLKFYRNIGVNYFKIQGRQSVHKGDPVKTLKHYFDEEYNGNLIDLFTLFRKDNNYQSYLPYINNKSLNGFLEAFLNKDFCKENCYSCDYCLKYAKKSINIAQTEDLNREIQEHHKISDSYINILKEVQQ
jgi:collagenase-like PrtC family protease